jgi:hypothetical protein
MQAIPPLRPITGLAMLLRLRVTAARERAYALARWDNEGGAAPPGGRILQAGGRGPGSLSGSPGAGGLGAGNGSRGPRGKGR